MATAAADRMAKKRARDKVIAQVEKGGGIVLAAPDVLAQRGDQLWAWSYGQAWTRLT